jgi:hypothetical protein
LKAHSPADYVLADLYAIRACIAGTASAEQQKRAMDWIITKAANLYDMSYRDEADGGARAEAFHEGRRFVGNQIVKMTRPETLEALERVKGKPKPKPVNEAKDD